MNLSQEELAELYGQATAQAYLLHALLVTLLKKNLLSDVDVDVMVESALASISQFNDPKLAAVAEILEDFRFLSRPKRN